MSGTGPATPPVRLRSLEFHLPGPPVPVADLARTEDLRARLQGIGQEFTFRSQLDSTELSIEAARTALEKADVPSDRIGLVVSAPTLTTSYGFEIPAIAIRAALGLENAECLNLAQGCVGFLSGLRIARRFLTAPEDAGDILVVTACKASTMMDDLNHGAFFWADAAAASVVTREPGPGLHVGAYAERSSGADWGAMRYRHGDGRSFRDCVPEDDLKLVVEFPDERAQMDYILGEQERCEAVISALLAAEGLAADDVDALFLPSIGRNRVPHLLSSMQALRAKVATDFRYGHMGGVDVMFFLDRHLRAEEPDGERRYLVLTPAYTAQWGGLALRFRP